MNTEQIFLRVCLTVSCSVSGKREIAPGFLVVVCIPRLWDHLQAKPPTKF